ncbi:flagellar hook-associated protein 1 [Nitrospira sp.]|nr:flagellar hook-associated protein 1 [Nitrospira sp.]
MSLTSIFDIGTSGLFAAQKALGVTSHNIANVHTPGYSRQQAVLAEQRPVDGRPGQVGTGVEVTEIRRQVDQFVERSLLSSRQQLGEFTASRSGLLQVEGTLSPSSEVGIATGLNEFFQAVQDVSTNPADPTARTVLLSKATSLTTRLNQTAVELDRQRVQVDAEVRQSIDDINGLTTKIAGLNQEITIAEAGGQHANDLRDQRGRLIGDLANLLNVATIEDQTGQLSVFAGNGQVLVTGGQTFQLVGVPNVTNGGVVDVRYDSGTGPVTDLTSVIDSGRLKGLLDVRDRTIPNSLASLDTLASTLVTEVNTVNRAGFGLDGSTNVNLFTPTGTAARDIAVAVTDGQQIAASSTAAGVPGNNANTLAMATLQTTSIAALGSKTFNGYFSQLVSGVGAQSKSADQDLQAQELVDEQLQARRAEVSGVSLDEELVNMIQQQRAYQAASKVIVTADEMLQTLLSLKR